MDLPTETEEIKKNACHTVSTFFLGILIAEQFGIDLCTDLPSKERLSPPKPKSNSNINFKYLWFLACLYHDAGYIYENRGKKSDPLSENSHILPWRHRENLEEIKKNGLEALQKICGIDYLCPNVFKTYMKTEVELYLKKRAEDCCIDHGIAGGLMLYDKLRKNFEKLWKTWKDKFPSQSREFFYTNDEQSLFASTDHHELYAKAADAVIAHNIWKDLFKEAVTGRNGSEFKKISMQKSGFGNSEDPANPGDNLLFVLSLADTIEPLKRGLRIDQVCFSFACDSKGDSGGPCDNLNSNNSKHFQIKADAEIAERYFDSLQKTFKAAGPSYSEDGRNADTAAAPADWIGVCAAWEKIQCSACKKTDRVVTISLE